MGTQRRESAKKNRQRLKKKVSICRQREIANSKKPKLDKSREIIIEKFQTHSGCQPKSTPTLKTRESAELPPHCSITSHLVCETRPTTLGFFYKLKTKTRLLPSLFYQLTSTITNVTGMLRGMFGQQFSSKTTHGS